MWNISELNSTRDNTRFTITTDDGKLTFGQFLQLLESSGPFRRFYNEALARQPYQAFLWENRPFNRPHIDKPYECNIIDSPPLARQQPDPDTFQAHFSPDSPVVSFPNLGGDARLITPCPQSDAADYTHIAHFVRRGERRQVDAFWQAVGRQSRLAIVDRPRWLSTSGLGVFWVHARIDLRPKYYQTAEFRQL